MDASDAKPNATSVAICVPSFRRPEGLDALLHALADLTFAEAAPELRIVVVDNDAEGSAEAVCEAAQGWLGIPLQYVREPRKGIPFARNAAVAAAADCDWIAFIDDDEIPGPAWLDTLLAAQRRFEADVVTGPALADFESPPAAWIEQGRFFDSPPKKTGTRLDRAYTHNVVARTERLLALPTLFDERFSLGVGEDEDVFERLAEAGAEIVWCAEAPVYETIPAERANFRWLMHRGYRIGTAASHIDRVRGRGGAARDLVHGGWCIAKGLAGSLVVFVGERAEAVRSLQLATYGLGRWFGLGGVR